MIKEKGLLDLKYKWTTFFNTTHCHNHDKFLLVFWKLLSRKSAGNAVWAKFKEPQNEDETEIQKNGPNNFRHLLIV